MKITKLNIKNYRNYDDLEIIFNDKLNIIIGNNAQGKTNILESIYFLSITKSFLGVNEKNLIRNNQKFSLVSGNIDASDSKFKLSIRLNENGKKLEYNGKEIKKHSDFIGNLKVIMFSPDDIGLIKDGPGIRRKFLNIEISQLYRKYITILNEFNVLLKQRNEYLKIIKNGRFNESYFCILNDKFVELSVQITKYRFDFINKINQYIEDIYYMISLQHGLQIKYNSSIEVTNDAEMTKELYLKLDNYHDREIMYGSSLVGPHRDDFSFNLDDFNLSLYGSQGQKKMAVLALKLAEIDVFENISGMKPVLLLDDLFSELDVNKRNRVINYLNKDIQTIITTTDLNNINNDLVEKSYVYEIEDGKIKSIKI